MTRKLQPGGGSAISLIFLVPVFPSRKLGETMQGAAHPGPPTLLVVLLDLPRYLSHLPEGQRHNVVHLIHAFHCLFHDILFRTSIMEHDVLRINPKPLKQQAYQANPAKGDMVKNRMDG